MWDATQLLGIKTKNGVIASLGFGEWAELPPVPVSSALGRAPFKADVPGRAVPSRPPSKTIGSLRLHFHLPCEIRFEGTLASAMVQNELKHHLAEMHDRILTDGCRVITADVQGLQFVDSSAIRLFVDWISRATYKYKIVFLIDPGTTWQRLSFSVLQSMAPDSVEVRESDRPSAAKNEPTT
jgi:hypothetical protein